MKTLDIAKIPAEDFSVIVGDISEGVYRCSYNEEDVFVAAFSGYLNQTIADLDKAELARFENLIGDYKTTDYEVLVRALLRHFEAWPINYGPELTPIDQLPSRYRDLIGDF